MKNFYEPHKKLLFYLFLLFSLHIFPLILSDTPYRDDIVRSMFSQGWLRDGRLLTDILFRIFSFGSVPLNFFPLMQLLSIPCLVLSCFLLYRRFLPDFPPFLGALALYLIFGHPFYLENLSFQYDALSMNLAVLLSILAFEKARDFRWSSFFLSIGLLLMALCFYEVVIYFFAGLCLLDSLRSSVQLEKSQKMFFLTLFSCALIALVSYALLSLITHPFLEGWALSHRGIIFFGTKEDWAKYFGTWKIYIGVFQKYWKVVLSVLCLLIGAECFWAYHCVVLWKNKKLRQWGIFVFYLFFPIVLLFLPFTPLLFLINPILTPRMLLSLGLFFLCFLQEFPKSFRKFPFSALIYILSLIFLSLSFLYADARKTHVNFEKTLSIQIFENLEKAGIAKEIHELFFVGKAPYNHSVEKFLSRFPFFLPMFPRYLSEGSPRWTFLFLHQFSMLPLVEENSLSEKEIEVLKMTKSIETNSLYKLKVWKHTAIVYWNPAFR